MAAIIPTMIFGTGIFYARVQDGGQGGRDMVSVFILSIV